MGRARGRHLGLARLPAFPFGTGTVAGMASAFEFCLGNSNPSSLSRSTGTKPQEMSGHHQADVANGADRPAVDPDCTADRLQASSEAGTVKGFAITSQIPAGRIPLDASRERRQPERSYDRGGPMDEEGEASSATGGTKLVATIAKVLLHAIERGDCRIYRAFDTDPRWQSRLEEARRADTAIGTTLRSAETAYRELALQELLDGPGCALVQSHPFNKMLARKGLLNLRAETWIEPCDQGEGDGSGPSRTVGSSASMSDFATTNASSLLNSPSEQI